MRTIAEAVEKITDGLARRESIWSRGDYDCNVALERGDPDWAEKQARVCNITHTAFLTCALMEYEDGRYPDSLVDLYKRWYVKGTGYCPIPN